ncbi:MAG: Wzz/FepE/Etk N-terminal domain-containing protein [Polyangiaceae bacterium]|nr:Wzz/FepE/Etk N-terminal domain-containing protein [Polyangiaceae bacterium]
MDQVTQAKDVLTSSKRFCVALRQRIWLILCTALLGTAVAALLGTQLQPLYTATALVVVNPRATRVLDSEQVLANLESDSATVATEARALTSTANLRKVIEHLHLVADPRFEGEKSWWADHIGYRLKQGWRYLAVEMLGGEAPAQSSVGTSGLKPDIDDPVLLRLRRGLQVSADKQSFVVAVSFTWADPELAAEIVNAVIGQYILAQLEHKRSETKHAAEWLASRLEVLRGDSERAETAVRTYREQNNLLGEQRTDIIEQRIADLHARLVLETAELAEREARLAFSRDLRERRMPLEALAEQPGIGTKIELPRPDEVRRLFLGRIGYFVYYRPKGRFLEVIAFWHASRETGPRM